MSKATTFLDIIDGRPFVKASRLRIGRFRARGVPSILLGVAAIVFAAGAGEGLRRAAAALPETIREARLLVIAARKRPELSGDAT